MSCDINRIYEDYDKDNVRVLVDRVWPRGISKEKANLDHWIKEIAPSDSCLLNTYPSPRDRTRWRMPAYA